MFTEARVFHRKLLSGNLPSKRHFNLSNTNTGSVLLCPVKCHRSSTLHTVVVCSRGIWEHLLHWSCYSAAGSAIQLPWMLSECRVREVTSVFGLQTPDRSLTSPSEGGKWALSEQTWWIIHNSNSCCCWNVLLAPERGNWVCTDPVSAQQTSARNHSTFKKHVHECEFACTHTHRWCAAVTSGWKNKSMLTFFSLPSVVLLLCDCWLLIFLQLILDNHI